MPISVRDIDIAKFESEKQIISVSRTDLDALALVLTDYRQELYHLARRFYPGLG